MSLPLAYYGNPVLRAKTAAVETFDDELARLADDMVETMRAEAGVGLAGPQVGCSRRIFVMEIPPEADLDGNGARLNPQLAGPLVVVNPELELDESEIEEMEEGCLSIPEVRGRVERSLSLKMTFQTVKGEARSLHLTGLAARCAQHEFDHLNGVLFIDLLGSVKKMAIKGKLKKIKLAHPVSTG